MAFEAFQAFEQPAVYASTATGTEGRDPGQWGTPNDPSHAKYGPGDFVSPGESLMAPGDEFAFHDPWQVYDGYQHGHVLDTTPVNPPGIGVDVAIGGVNSNWIHPHSEQSQEIERELTEAHAMDMGGPLRARWVNPPAYHGFSEQWDMPEVDYGAKTGGPYNDSGLLVTTPGARTAHDMVRGDHDTKTLKGPIVDYGERPIFNNIAAVVARSEAPRSLLAPQNNYDDRNLVQPGKSTAYQAPPDPAMVAPTVSDALADDYGWMTYGG